MTYLCSAYGCGNSIARKYYWCKGCYAKLPFKYKEQLAETYKRGQLKTEEVPVEFISVLAEAARWLAEEEGKLPID